MVLPLILSVLVLLAAPLLARLVGKMPALKGGLDGFVLVTVLGLILLTLLPESLSHGGPVALLIAALGFSLPWIAEFLFHKAEEMTHRIVMLVATLALVVHAASDGAILAFADESESGSLVAIGIILHRIGIGFAVWWLLRPILTTWGGVAVLIALAVMTVVGYLSVVFAGQWYGFPLIGYWQAFAAGSLLHVVLHPLEDHDTKPVKDAMFAHRIGTGAGVLFLVGLVGSHYLHHAPSPVEMVHAHELHHVLDLIFMIGRLIAPLLLLVLAAAATLRRIYGGTLPEIYALLQKIAPWTLVAWLATALGAEIVHAEVPAPVGGHVMFGIWITAVCTILVHTGARAFFSVLMPRFGRHRHSH